MEENVKRKKRRKEKKNKERKERGKKGGRKGSKTKFLRLNFSRVYVRFCLDKPINKLLTQYEEGGKGRGREGRNPEEV